MRLDKFLSKCKVLSRKETVVALKKKQITINGVLAKNKDQEVSEKDEIKYDNNIVKYNEFIYIMLNKPKGYVSSTDDPRDKTVLDLLNKEYQKYNLFPCGRLDKDTVGLIILTNDGVNTHLMLSPKNSIQKKYYFELADKVNTKDISVIEQGVCLRDGYSTKPCKIEMISDDKGYIYLTEGKYHEIKRMFGFVNNKVIYLKRISFDKILLDNNLKEGEFRLFTEKEIEIFTRLK